MRDAKPVGAGLLRPCNYVQRTEINNDLFLFVKEISVMKIILDGSNLKIDNVVKVARDFAQVELAPVAIERVNESRKYLEKVLKEEKPVYGLNTGFGAFENITVDRENIEKLQMNLIRSHSVGVGEPLSEEIVRATILVRINSLIRGQSGIRIDIVNGLMDLLNKKIYPFVPSKGSLGASGDLCPLSHIALVLAGEGEVFINEQIFETRTVLKKLSIKPIRFSYKEGLALNNGTALMTGLGALNVYDALILCKTGDISAAMSTEALLGTDTSFQPEIHMARPHPGQIESAENLFKFCQGSSIIDSHKGCKKVQDSYSLRCIPQVHGAVRGVITYVKSVIDIELNSTTDNPLIFYEEGKIYSGGNFHGEPLAFAMDFLSIVMTELGNISERRVAKLVDGKNNRGLPMFLVNEPLGGLNSGFMIPQYTAASLVSENKVLSHPASVDSIPTSANQEDHVSMGTIAARQAREIINNTSSVIAIELMTASQALDFRKPLSGGAGTSVIYDYIRSLSSHLSEDRVIYKELNMITESVKKGIIIDKIEEKLGKMN